MQSFQLGFLLSAGRGRYIAFFKYFKFCLISHVKNPSWPLVSDILELLAGNRRSIKAFSSVHNLGA